ncbi:MAG: adenylate/guanylate cyclase domain-containing protein [bacterium]|nr:adenylate/guanylate cyclase domain-containing protein [bacterium]
MTEQDDLIKKQQEEIEYLKKKIEQYEQQQKVTLSSMSITQVPSNEGTFTIKGLEEAVIHIDEKNRVKYCNSQFLKLIGCSHKEEIKGKEITDSDFPGFSKEFLLAIIGSAQTSGKVFVTERRTPEIVEFMCSEDKEKFKSEGPLLRYVVTPLESGIQIVIQDVSKVHWLETTFGKYVSPKVIQQMLFMDENQIMTTERRRLTILFADLRGFTKMCQEITPEEIVETLNSYLSNMVNIIEANDGTIDKFVGDEIMAFWGAPINDEFHALKAFVTSIEMQKAHREMMKSRLSNNKIMPPIGIGIAAGEVVIGNIGTPKRLDFTVLGHTVNLAARLCGKAESGEILTTKETHTFAMDAYKNYNQKAVPKMKFSGKGKLELKNVKEAIEVFSINY